MHLDTAPSNELAAALENAVAQSRLTGATARGADGVTASAGDPLVTDPLTALTKGRSTARVLRRHPEAFFQGNRFLVGPLVAAVIDVVPPAAFSISTPASVCSRSASPPLVGAR